MSILAAELFKRLEALSNPADAIHLQRFFKTGKGDYGEGDIFRGIRTPSLRKLAKEYLKTVSLSDLELLLHSAHHEDRALAVIMLADLFERGDETLQADIYKLYLENTRHVNNWDLVDISSPQVVGGYLFDKDRSILDKLAESELLWERRISIIATLHFIRRKQFDDTLRIAAKLLGDRHDLMHKAVGWMLREVGKRDLAIEELFLGQHYLKMPRTMLRYAIERFPEPKRKSYLAGKM